MNIDFSGTGYFLVSIMVLGGIVAAPVSAADWYVSIAGNDANNGSLSSPWGTITHAVGNASVADSDTIHIAAGTYPESNISITKNLTLTGAGADVTIVDGMQAPVYSGGVFSAIRVTASLEGLTIRNGLATHLGGGVYGSNSILTIDGCIIEGNSANSSENMVPIGDGGGVFLNGSFLELVNSTLRDNVAGVQGGGIHAADGSANISVSVIENNTAPDYGGGIYGSDLSLTLSDCYIMDNTAKGGYGGGIFLDNGSLRIEGCTIEGNRAYLNYFMIMSGEGGGMFLNGSFLEMVNCTLCDNFAAVRGGGFHASGGAAAVLGSVIEYNTVEYGYGGGVSQEGGGLEILQSAIECNTAMKGGGVGCTKVDPFILSNTTLAQNSASYGGGIYQADGNGTVTDATFSDNDATYSGGGVFQDHGDVFLSASTIDQNTAGWYGGGVFQDGGTMAISDCTITDNIADYGGWGVHSNGTITIYNCYLRNTRNYYRDGGIATLNTRVVKSVNIVGGPFIGGNYWGSPSGDGYSDTCPDLNGDGFGDIPYTVAGATDEYPLVSPLTNFTVTQRSGPAPMTVRFYDVSHYKPINWIWDFGDGATLEGDRNPVHTYMMPGMYNVSLCVDYGPADYEIVKPNYIIVHPPNSNNWDTGDTDKGLATREPTPVPEEGVTTAQTPGTPLTPAATMTGAASTPATAITPAHNASPPPTTQSPLQGGLALVIGGIFVLRRLMR